MRDRLSVGHLMMAAVGGLILAGSLPTHAAAQGMIFDWGGEDKTATSGKGHVKFNGGGKPGDIIVSFGDRKLYFFTAPGEADTYLVATPRDQSRWEGVTSVTQKRENPSWTPTAHMLQENPKLPRWVPGGHPMNPLGIRALYLGSSDYRIHGTDAPWTIGTPVSKGCVRMFNKDVVELYPRVKVGTKVIVTWQKFDTRTQSMANLPNKGITELAAGEVSKSTAASYAPAANSVTAPPARSKWKRAADDDQADASNVKTEEISAEAPKLAAVSESEDFVAPRKRKSVAATESEGVTGEVREPADAVKPLPARTDRPSKVKSVKSDASADSVTTPVKTSKRGGDQASLDVAERALAAAERAANAAERAAAAAERAVAVGQGRGVPSVVESVPSAVAPVYGDVRAH
jgi:lipoprotein-anchoring transpeptidase ErfK/SrfK